MKTYEIELHKKRPAVVIPVVQYDTDRTIRFEVTDDDIADGTEVRLYVRKPSGKEVYNKYTSSQNGVTVTMTSQTLAESGEHVPAQLQFKKSSSQTVSTFLFYLNIEQSLVSDMAIESKDELNVFDSYLQEARQRLNDCAAQLADMKKQADLIGDGNIGTSTSPTHTLSTSEGAAVIRELPGVTEQVVTTGAQLIDFENVTVNRGTLIDGSKGTYLSNINNQYYFQVILNQKEVEKIRQNLGKRLVLQIDEGIPKSFLSVVLHGTRANGTAYQEVSSDPGESFLPFNISADFSQITDVEIRLNRRLELFSDTTTTVTGVMLYLEESGQKPFEPYTGGKPGPNPDYPQRIEGLGDSGWFDGELQQGGYDSSTGGYRVYSSNVSNLNKIRCKENDMIQLEYEVVTDFLVILFYKEDGSFLKSLSRQNVKTILAEAPAQTYYFNFCIQRNSGLTPQTAGHITVLKNGKYAVQVKSCGKNKESTAYIELDQPLYTGDKIYLEDGYLWEYRENGVVVYDGSADEEWNVYQFTNLCAYIVAKDIKRYGPHYCNTYLPSPSGEETPLPNGTHSFAIEGIGAGVNGPFFGIKGLATDVPSWRTWLAAHPITMVYKLATPTKTRLNQPSAYGLRTYGEQTHIWIPDNLQPEFAVDYPINQAGGYALDGFCQSRINEAQEEINRQALDDRISKIEVDLGANTFIVE